MLCVEWHSTNTLHQYAINNHNDKTPNSEDKLSTTYIVLFDMKSSEQDTCLEQTFISSLSVFFYLYECKCESICTLCTIRTSDLVALFMYIKLIEASYLFFVV